jgi:hypothetical protein
MARISFNDVESSENKPPCKTKILFSITDDNGSQQNASAHKLKPCGKTYICTHSMTRERIEREKSNKTRKKEKEKEEKRTELPWEEHDRYLTLHMRPRNSCHTVLSYLAIISPSKPYILFMLLVSWLPRICVNDRGHHRNKKTTCMCVLNLDNPNPHMVEAANESTRKTQIRSR